MIRSASGHLAIWPSYMQLLFASKYSKINKKQNEENMYNYYNYIRSNAILSKFI